MNHNRFNALRAGQPTQATERKAMAIGHSNQQTGRTSQNQSDESGHSGCTRCGNNNHSYNQCFAAVHFRTKEPLTSAAPAERPASFNRGQKGNKHVSFLITATLPSSTGTSVMTKTAHRVVNAVVLPDIPKHTQPTQTESQSLYGETTQISVDINGKSVVTLVDSCSSASLMAENVAKHVGLTIQPVRHSEVDELKGATSHSLDIIGKVTFNLWIGTDSARVCHPILALVAKTLSAPFVIGQNWIRQYVKSINVQSNSITMVDDRTVSLLLGTVSDSGDHSEQKQPTVSDKDCLSVVTDSTTGKPSRGEAVAHHCISIPARTRIRATLGVTLESYNEILRVGSHSYWIEPESLSALKLAHTLSCANSVVTLVKPHAIPNSSSILSMKIRAAVSQTGSANSTAVPLDTECMEDEQPVNQPLGSVLTERDTQVVTSIPVHVELMNSGLRVVIIPTGTVLGHITLLHSQPISGVASVDSSPHTQTESNTSSQDSSQQRDAIASVSPHEGSSMTQYIESLCRLRRSYPAYCSQ
jgi:hypothetical protein